LDQRAVAAHLSTATVGIAPYPPTEFFYFSPLKIVEYMMAGLPVVTTRVGSLASIVGDGGMTVDPSDDEALANALDLLFSNPGLARSLGRRGMSRARRHYTWNIVAQQIERCAAGATI
jgi:glycosyltransferase involved in cell wall biosynthesis